MTESYTDGLRSPAVALLHSPLKRLAVPVIAIVAMAGLAEFLTYFAVAPRKSLNLQPLLRLWQHRPRR